MVQIIKNRLLPITIIVTAVMVLLLVSVGLALDSSAPAVVSVAPADGASVASTTTTVSFTVYDPDLIAGSGFYIKVNGASVNSTIKFKGHWEEGVDSCGSSFTYWVVDSYQEATISATVANLKDGVQNVEALVKDRLGNAVTKTWTFDTAVPPVFSNMLPGAQGLQSATPTISVKVSDPNGQVDASSVKLAVDDPVNILACSFDAATGIVSAVIPAPGLSDGTHTAYVIASDTTGNQASRSWTFTVHANGPQLTFAGADKNYDVFNPTIEVAAGDPANVSDQGYEMYVDGQKLDSTFTYNTVWVDGDEYTNPYSYTDTQNAVLRAVPKLSDGPHTLTVKVKDKLGNYSEQTWNFNVEQAPVLSDFTPADGSVVNGVSTVRAKVYDPNGPALDIPKLNLTVDGKPVVFDTIYNPDNSLVVSYTYAGLSNDSNHTVSLIASDTLGHSAAKQWKFYDGFVGVAGEFTRFQPEDTVFTTSRPSFQIHFSDPGNSYDVPPVYSLGDTCNTEAVISGTRVLIDGVIQADNERGDWKYYGDKLPTVTGSAPEYLISYTANTLTDGKHTVTFNIPSKTGGQPAVFTKEFTVSSPPVISRHLPVNTVTTSTPTIAVSATDNSGIGRVLFTIDGNPPVTVTNSQQAANDGINLTSLRYTAPQLSNGAHEIRAVIYDSSGLSTEGKWNFNIDTNTGVQGISMPVDNATCHKCHSNDYNNGTNGGMHPMVPSCLRCHTTKEFLSTTFQYCTSCHYGGPSYSPRHSSDGYVAGWRDIENLRHPINDIHLSATTGCEECHSRILNVEHNGRKDSNGNPVTCDTCHTGQGLQPDEYQKISTVITNKDTRCTSCHDNTDHEAVHKDELDDKCQTCHAATLTTEHINNQTTAGKNYSCSICHSSANPDVQRTITFQSVSCAGCHKEGHGIKLADKIPADIPLYQGFEWSLPMAAAIYTGEPHTPVGYESGEVVMSNRRPVPVTDIWLFYNTNLSANGWILKSQAPAADAAFFTVVFTKDHREVTVKSYNTELAEGTGKVTSGYRVEIWYK